MYRGEFMFYLDNAKREFQKCIIEYHSSIAKGEDVQFVINEEVIYYLKEFNGFYQIEIKSIMGESIIVTEKELKNGKYFSILKNENTINYVKIGFQIRSEREKFGMTREDLSGILDISCYFLGQVERGDRGMSVKGYINVCECLHISMDSLFSKQANIDTSNNTNDIYSLLNKCTEKETIIIESIIKLLLPHLIR